MSDLDPSVESRLNRLSEQIRDLGSRMDELTAQVLALSSGPQAIPAASAPADPAVLPKDGKPAFSAPDALSGVAVVCFLLVVALILRALTDNQTVNRPFGTFLGIAYAAVLVFFGYWVHRRRRFAAIYTICGAVLLCSIVFETHSRFHVLPASYAYAILAVTLAATAFLGRRAQAPLLVCFGIVGASFTGTVLDFPDPLFPGLMALLFLANVAAYACARTQRCSWIKWVLLLLTLFIWLVWAAKAHFAFSRGAGTTLAGGLPWLLPELAAFVCAALFLIIAAVLRRDGAVRLYEIITPPTVIAASAAIGRTVAIPHYGSTTIGSAAGIALGLGILLLAVGFSTKHDKGLWATPSVLTGSLVLLAVFVPGCLPQAALAPLVWSGLATAIGLFPLLAKNKAACVISHLFQGFACIEAVQAGLLSVGPGPSAPKTPALVLLAAFSAAHYMSYRVRASRANSESFDPASWTMASPLVATLVYGYGISRLALYAGLIHFQAGDDMFQAGQSVLINLGALLVATVGVILMFGEILVVATAVALIGAAKVFLYDFSRLHGLPAVISVSSFGVTTALGALLWARWQRRASQDKPEEPE